jgi:hypothetical protein
MTTWPPVVRNHAKDNADAKANVEPIYAAVVFGSLGLGVRPAGTRSTGETGVIKSEEGTTLRLPESMADELPAYQKAASEGTLIKTKSSELPRSYARELYENNYGEIPEGYDVDHIIQRQHGGGEGIENLQLKEKSQNRSEGSKAYQLNKGDPYGTLYTKVELVKSSEK